LSQPNDYLDDQPALVTGSLV